MLIMMPESKAYLPGPGKCIYCVTNPANPHPLITCPPSYTCAYTREHIIPGKLGGQLILHQSVGESCQTLINQQIEIPSLKRMLITPRTLLNMKTSDPKATVKVGRPNGQLNVPGVNLDGDFDFSEEEKSNHDIIIMLPRLSGPGLLRGRESFDPFTLYKPECYFAPSYVDNPTAPDNFAVQFEVNYEILGRFIAKIAHSAAVAEFGMDAFAPWLPDIIMNRSPCIPHLIGSSPRRGRRTDSLHQISFFLEQGYLVAAVQLFSRYGMRAFHAVVGPAAGSITSLSTWCTSSFKMRSITPA